MVRERDCLDATSGSISTWRRLGRYHFAFVLLFTLFHKDLLLERGCWMDLWAAQRSTQCSCFYVLIMVFTMLPQEDFRHWYHEQYSNRRTVRDADAPWDAEELQDGSIMPPAVQLSWAGYQGAQGMALGQSTCSLAYFCTAKSLHWELHLSSHHDRRVTTTASSRPEQDGLCGLSQHGQVEKHIPAQPPQDFYYNKRL